MDRVQHHKEIVLALNDLYARKNADYGNSVSETYKLFGLTSFLTRIYDKFNRVATLSKLPEGERKVKDESIKDTLLDMANYAILAVIELDADKEEESKIAMSCEEYMNKVKENWKKDDTCSGKKMWPESELYMGAGKVE